MQEPQSTASKTGRSESQAPASGGSERTLSESRPRLPLGLDPDIVKQLLKPQEAQQMLEELRRSCVATGELARPIEEMTEELYRSGYKQESSAILRGSLASASVRPEVGTLWMRRVLNRRTWDRRYPEGMDELCQRGEVGYRAVIEFLEAASNAGKAGLVRRALRKHSRWLRQHPVGWGVAARALTTARCYSLARKWMSDWRQRPELDSSLLYCLVVALRGSGRKAEALEATRLAMEKCGTDPRIRLWHAMNEALAGNTESAAAAFKELGSPDWDKDSFNRYYLVRGMIRVQKAEPGFQAEALESASGRAEEHFRRPPVYKRDVLVRREYRQCMCRMARDAGDWRAFCRACWRSADSAWLLIPLLILPGLQLVVPLYLFRLCSRRRGKS
jgi:hypothetical protein